MVTKKPSKISILSLGVFGLLTILRSGPSRAAEFVDNPGVVEIDHPELFDRLLVISDVHGMYHPLVKLLKTAQIILPDLSWTAGKALLIVVGDSIDKGPDSVEVLDLWRSLQIDAERKGGSVIHLLGNHEAEFLANSATHVSGDLAESSSGDSLISEIRRKNIPLSEFLDPQFSRARYLYSMPIAARVGSWLFCHSGFYPNLKWPEFKNKAQKVLIPGKYGDPFLQDEGSILRRKKWDKDFEQREILISNLQANNLFGVVFGHQPKALGAKGKTAVSFDGHFIKIDNGMAPQAGSHSGSILIFKDPKELRKAQLPHAVTFDSGGNVRTPSKEKVQNRPT